MKTKIKNNIGTIVVGLLCIAAIVTMMVLPIGKEDSASVRFSDYSAVSAVGKLATLRSYYHNVVIYEKQEGADIGDVLLWPLNVIFKKGYKQFWMEYDGIAEYGVDLKKDNIRIYDPDENNVVDIYVPDASVLRIGADESTLSEPLDETGLFTAITAKERFDALAASQSEMEQNAQNDQALLGRAKNNVKMLLEKYVANLGNLMGTKFTIHWLDSPR